MKTVIATTAAPGAIGPYSQAIEAGGFVFVSGQLPLAPATGAFVLGGFAGGLVGGKLFKKVPNLWLRRIFALFLLYGGWRYLFTGG